MSKSSNDINNLLSAAKLSDAERLELMRHLIDSGAIEAIQDIGAAHYVGARFKVLTTEEILDRMVAETDAVSDYGVAKLLKIPRATVSRWRNGKTMNDENAHRAAALLGEDPDYVVACLNAERAKSRAARFSFSRLARLAKGLSIVTAKKGKAAAVGAVAIIGVLSFGDTETVLSLAASVPVFAYPSIHYAHIAMGAEHPLGDETSLVSLSICGMQSPNKTRHGVSAWNGTKTIWDGLIPPGKAL